MDVVKNSYYVDKTLLIRDLIENQVPVISITFKDAKFSDWASTYAAIKNVIRAEFMRHDELFTSDSLNPVEQDYLFRMQSDKLSDVEYTRALLNLGRMLEKHHLSEDNGWNRYYLQLPVTCRIFKTGKRCG